MKAKSIQKEEGNFSFERADQFMDFAEQKELDLIGHVLVWARDERTQPWLLKQGDEDASAELLLQRMKNHIDTVVGRYRGRIHTWDVLNEALSDGEELLRPSGLLRIAGDEFLVKAFEYAHAADPDALLIYNDYNNELPGKREKMIEFLTLLKERGAPIHAVGIQGHYQIDDVPYEDIEITLNAMRELNLKVVVSELDIDVIPRNRWWADDGMHREEMKLINPYADGLPEDLAQRQAEQYAQLFRLFKKHADVVERVTFWNLHDGRSWLNHFPWKRVNHPLLFDRNAQPKPALKAVIDALEEE